MTRVIFYEKPGCSGNAKQRAMLHRAGHDVEAHSLLSHPWQREELRSFFGTLPVELWFNRNAPRVKSGEVDPTALNDEAALDLMLREPLLIRRPLLEIEGQRFAGFEPAVLEPLLGLLTTEEDVGRSLEACQGGARHRCD